MSDCRPIIFIDGVTEAQVANGVARITLVVVGKNGHNIPSATICIPVAQLSNFITGLSNLSKKIESSKQWQSNNSVPKLAN